MIGVVIPTCDEARRPFLDFLLKRLQKQTMRADYVKLVDYPNETGRSDIAKRYIEGIEDCFDNGCKFVLLMEDDDYYPLRYIEQMYDLWKANGKPKLMGADRYTYYHIFERMYKCEGLRKHSSAFTTAVSPGVKLNGTEDAMLFDIVLWNKNSGVLVKLKDEPLGIKHGIGHTGGNGHYKRFFKTVDTDMSYLRSRVDDEAYEFYSTFDPGGLTLTEWHDTLMVADKAKRIKQKYGNRVAWALDTSYAGFPFIVNYLDCVPIVYNRRLKYYDEMVHGLLSYVDGEGLDIICQAKHIYLFGAKGTEYLINLLRSKGKRLKDYQITYLITDSWYYKDKEKNFDRINRELAQVADLQVFVMPDKAFDVWKTYPDAKLYMQSIPQMFTDVKHKEFYVAHSPGLKAGTNEKGTEIIKQVCKELKIDIEIITGLPWRQAINRKAGARVFVDQLITKQIAENLQIPEYRGGLGKSGVEAMLAGCVVVTSGMFAGTDEFQAPPVIGVKIKAELKKKLKALKEMYETDLASFDALAEKQRIWAEKHTDLQFNLRRLAPELTRVDQMHCSYTLRFFEQAMREKYQLREVYDPLKPVVIFGMYRDEDYLFAERHNGKKIIVWGGTDVTYLEKTYAHYLPIEGKHIAISPDLQKRLKAQGIDAELVPITPTKAEIDLFPKGNSVYFYGSGEKYGEALMDEIEKHIKYDVIRANGQYTKEQLRHIYKQCFMGLRLTPKDGLANTVIELGLMGRRCLWNCGDLPNAIKYDPKDIKSIVSLIDEEYQLRERNNENIANEVKEFLTRDETGWLYVDNEKPNMKIIAIAFVYNEIDYLPFALNYYKAQGVDLYVIDNYSDDGTWEYLQEQGIESHRFDTDGMFHLQMLQDEMLRVLKHKRPDWFVWFSPDLFHMFTKLTLREAIETSDRLKYNQIKSVCYQFQNTGEEFALPLPKNYRYGKRNEKTLLISRWSEEVEMRGDRIILPESNVIEGGVILEYGACKPKCQQEVKFARREKAWQDGLNRGSGVHYINGKKHNWVHDKCTLTDITLTVDRRSVEKLMSYEV